MVPVVFLWIYFDTVSNAVLSSELYSRPASHAHEAVGEYHSHQFTAVCDAVDCSLSTRPRGTPRIKYTFFQSVTVSKALDTFSAVRLGSGAEQRGKKESGEQNNSRFQTRISNVTVGQLNILNMPWGTC